MALPPQQARRRLSADRGERESRRRVIAGPEDPRLREEKFRWAAAIVANNDAQYQINKDRARTTAAQPSRRSAGPWPWTRRPPKSCRRRRGEAGEKSGREKGGLAALVRAGVRQGRTDPVAPISRPGHREPLRHVAASGRDARGLD